MAAKPHDIPVKKESQDVMRSTYLRLFFEMQFRGTKNALMNYNEADVLKDKARLFGIATNVITGLSASGILASLVQKGKSLLGSKAGVVGILGIPISGLAQILNNSTSDLLPSYKEKAKKHINAAAGWTFLSSKARVTRLRMLADPEYDLEKAKDMYDELLLKREEISKLVLISEKTSKEIALDTEKVFMAMKRRSDAFKDFEDLEKKYNHAMTDMDNPEDIFF